MLRINVNGRERFSLSELEPETEYTIVIQLKNIVGTSPESQALSFKTRSIGKIKQVAFSLVVDRNTHTPQNHSRLHAAFILSDKCKFIS